MPLLIRASGLNKRKGLIYGPANIRQKAQAEAQLSMGNHLGTNFDVINWLCLAYVY